MHCHVQCKMKKIMLLRIYKFSVTQRYTGNTTAHQKRKSYKNNFIIQLSINLASPRATRLSSCNFTCIIIAIIF